MTKVLVSGDPEQPAPCPEAGRELEVGEIGPTVSADEPILLLGEIVMANARAMQLVQHHLCRTEICDIVKRLCLVQGYSVDETAHQRLAAGPQQFRPDTQVARQGKRVALAREQMARRKIGPPRNLVDSAQYRINVAVGFSKTAAFDRGEHVTL